ncbi:MAG: DUF4956 domain-containing protein [Anaerolineae bacterium]|jgi:uncharacterized membrane protein YhiD involved in acid resistance|nr:DUF4956 domain-containing protein [Anaerolineae bacterium]MBT4310400.1 DUF4956 domain-containing protein [Anaerolineae bacterium]MBT4457750.1 DUF4956 domain-containing protein [Anaerolineae bacterium]MBT6061189.1 DUF4956 domain-containing protein [Anaerolineae bacterium]MBT6321147.1 DUF4956 domain-containing protein [Anaerolineae bacterium]
MKKLKRTFLIIILLLLFLLPTIALAQGSGFSETFDDSTLQEWEAPHGVSVENGVLKISDGGFALHFGDWSEITLMLKFKFSGEGEGAVNYYFRDEGRYGFVFSENVLYLEKETPQGMEMLGDAKAAVLQPDTWINLKIIVSDGQHQIYLNDELQVTITDPSPLETGAVMFNSRGLTLEFDDLSVQGTPGFGAMPEGEDSPEGEESPMEGEAPPIVEGAPEVGETTAPATDTTQPATTSQTKDSLMQELFSSQANPTDLTTFLINMVLAAIAAFILSLVYIHWGSSLSNRRKFAANFMLMTITTTFIILVVRSSVALSLGLVGALSIVRFRTAVKEPEELAYLFFAIGIGIGLGDNQRLITLLALVIGIIIIGLNKLLRRAEADVNLHLSIASQQPAKVELEQIESVLRQHTAKMKLLRFDETAEMLEAGFLIEFREMSQLNETKQELRALSEQIEITFMDNKGVW